MSDNKIKIKHGFAFKLSLYIVTCVVVTFMVVLIYNYYVSRNTIMKNIEDNAKILATSTIREISKSLDGAKQIAEDISFVFEYSEFTEKELMGLLENIVRKDDKIYGSVVSFEPYKFDKNRYFFGPYFYKSNGDVRYSDLGAEKYNYFKQDWYTTPKKLNKGVWSEPYFSKSGGILMVTYSELFYKKINGKREFCGIVACDVDLNWLRKFITDIHIFKTGYVFILSAKGAYIEHKDKDYTCLKKDIFSLAAERRDAKLKELGERMTSNQKGFGEYYSYTLNKKCFISYEPLKEAGWSIGVVIPKDELLLGLNTVTLKLFIIGAIGYILTLVLIIFLANKITMPLRALASATYEIGEGDFNVKIPAISSADEIGVLSRSFHNMQDNLIKYIANLQETTAAKEKIEKELTIACEIQQSLLPHKFPDLKQIDLYATLIPAKEVGGDLYDFFFIDKKHLCFAIGDVSGKGVPAALFMAVTKTLLRAKINLTMNPAKVLDAMNEDLCKENESFMFVTFFLGVFDLETGVLEYCSAGHNPPLIHTENKGFYYFRTKEPYPPLGIMADINYTGDKIKLLPEDMIFLYTDGITEAMNIDDVQFSDEKLLDILTKNKNETVLNIVNNVKTAVEQHASGTMQSDDITMFILKYNG